MKKKLLSLLSVMACVAILVGCKYQIRNNVTFSNEKVYVLQKNYVDAKTFDDAYGDDYDAKAEVLKNMGMNISDTEIIDGEKYYVSRIEVEGKDYDECFEKNSSIIANKKNGEYISTFTKNYVEFVPSNYMSQVNSESTNPTDITYAASEISFTTTSKWVVSQGGKISSDGRTVTFKISSDMSAAELSKKYFARTVEGTSYENINIDVEPKEGVDVLVAGKEVVNPKDIFTLGYYYDDQNHVWEIDRKNSYWVDSVGNKVPEGTKVEPMRKYGIHLVVKPTNTVYEYEIKLENIKNVVLDNMYVDASNEGPGYGTYYSGTGIIIQIPYYSATINDVEKYYPNGSQVKIKAETKEGKHFVSWSGSYHTGAGTQSVVFEDDKSEETSFIVKYSDTGIKISNTYEDHEYVSMVKKVAPFYGVDGTTEGVKCKICGFVKEAPARIPMLVFDNNTVKKVTVKGKKKALDISWKKAKDATGYEVQVSLSSKFKGAKKATIKKGKIVKTTVKKLKSKKKYYVRVRAFNKSALGTHYSNWVAAKKAVKTK